MRITILHAHSVHNDLNLISCRLQLQTDARQEDFQFYTSLEEVKKNPMSLEAFINNCKAKAKELFLGTDIISSKEFISKAVEVSKSEVVVEAPVVESVEVAVEPVAEPVKEEIPSVDSAIESFLKRNFKTKKELTTTYGSTIVEKMKAHFKDSKVVFDKELSAYLAEVLTAKEAVKEEKVEELLLKKPQATEMLEEIQRNFLTATYNKMLAMEKFAYLKDIYPAGACLKDLLAYKLPVKVAKRVGNGEYEIHETLESVFLGVFENKALNTPQPADF